MRVFNWLLSVLSVSLSGVALVDGQTFSFKFSSNPWIRHVAGSDPAANVWGDTVWVYTSMDANLRLEGLPSGTFLYDYMDGYRAFSSTDMVNWVDHGEVFHSRNCAWGIRGWMWAPSAHWNGKSGSEAKYYLYYPHKDKEQVWRIGVATASNPAGPFTDIGAPIPGLSGIDPHVFKDDDGQVYMYYNQFEVVKLKDNFVELAEAVRKIDYGLPSTTDYRFQFEEGSFMHKYKGKYYYSYSHWHAEEPTMAYYAIGSSPYGPFKWEGGLTGRKSGSQDHHSIIEFKGEWWYFTHMGTPWQELNQLNWYGQRRISCYQKMYYNDDGTIRRVDPHTYAINSGEDGPFVASDGIEYYWDQWYSFANTQIGTVGSSVAIANTVDDQLYRSYRWGNSFKYDVPVENNIEYIVTFKFAEIYHFSAGMRKFNVFLEGEAKINDLDVFAKAGGKDVAFDETHTVIVRDHVLNIQFTSNVDNAMVAGIYIRPKVVAPTPTVPVPSPVKAPVPIAPTPIAPIPTAPVPIPTAPVPTPMAPVPTPKAPAPTPTPPAPVPTPKAPAPTPTAPTPTAPAPTPTAPAPSPTAPAPSPTAPAPTPTAPAPTPTAPAPTPTAPVPTSPVVGSVPTPTAPVPTGALPTVPPIPIAPPIPVPTAPMAPVPKEPTMPPRVSAPPTRPPTRPKLPRIRSFLQWLLRLVN